MGAFQDLTGKKFGRLKVLALAPKSSPGKTRWKCACDCGSNSIVESAQLKSGNTKSCGCLRDELSRLRTKTHGLSDTPTYRTWSDMKGRCFRTLNRDYPDYGGRGITVCDRWKNSFEDFVSDMGERPKGSTIDRIDVDGNYEPGNCRWATSKQQQRNKRNSRLITFRKRRRSLAEWAEGLGMPYDVLRYRLDAGWTVEEAFQTPVRALEDFLTHEGVRKTKAQWCKDKGLTQNALLARLKNGWSIEATLNTPLQEKKKPIRELTYNGRTQGKAQWAREMGLPETVLLNRLRLGWPVEKALTTPMQHKQPREFITFNGKTQSKAAWAREMGLSESCVNARFKAGWPAEKALTTPSLRAQSSASKMP